MQWSSGFVRGQSQGGVQGVREAGGKMSRRFWGSAALAAAIALAVPLRSPGEIVTLKNGMQLEGEIGKIASIVEDPLQAKTSPGGVEAKLVTLVDDGLRRTFFCWYQQQAVAPSAQAPQERIKIQKRVAQGGRRVASVGPTLGITPFDEWGNRVFSMLARVGSGPPRRVDVIQGITEITPTHTKVEGLLAQAKYSYVWDMRVATSSIPAETLNKVLMKQIDPKSPDGRLSLVRLYIQSGRYDDARVELEAAVKDFPELADLQNRVKALRQLAASKLLNEIELRRQAGQHGLAVSMLRGFREEGVAGETLLQVREVLADYERRAQQGQNALKMLAAHASELEGEDIKGRIAAIRREIEAELNFNTLDRMADYLRLADDEKLNAQQKLSLAISGWLLGSGAGVENLAVSLALLEARDAVRSYLQAERQQERDAALAHIKGAEGVSVGNLAKLVAHMLPAIETQPPSGDTPGLFELTTPGLEGDPNVEYFVQLPPEYDPHRRYPCVVTLNGEMSELRQIDWWAGQYDKQRQMRLGQATRHGYVVIAPRWRKLHQREYQYSAREHAAVLYSLRDASRRFAIDSDRVFLTGHSIGGDAAWDIGLAHPDLWAGVLPIVAACDKYVVRYWENARHVPLYFVSGELDGDNRAQNGVQWDRYLTKQGFDTMVVEYKGRGHEHFHDEIQRIFEWMNLHKRDFFRRQFACVAMRPWDNFFWWVEVAGYPDRSMVAPLNWPQPNAKDAQTEGQVLANNGVTVRTAASRAALWLSPEIVDFDKPIAIVVNGRRQKTQVQPSVEVLLEDVRTRGDRQHPFWAKVE